MSDIPEKVSKEEMVVNFNTLLNRFDFQKVHDIMVLLDWKWGLGEEYKIPDIVDMQQTCSRLYQWAMESDNCIDPKEVSSGGFTLIINNNGDINISFVAVSYSYLYECQEVI